MRRSNLLARAWLRKAESSPVLRKVRPVAGAYRNESLGRLVLLAWCLHTLWETSGRLGQQLGCVRAGDLCVRARPRLECLRPVQSFATQVAFRGLTASKRDRAARGAIAGQPVVATACERSVGSGCTRGSDVRRCAPMSCRVAEVGGRCRAQRSATRVNRVERTGA